MFVYLGEHLRQYRKNKGLNREEFAISIHISKDYLEKLESKSNNRRKPLSMELTADICELFDDYSLYVDWCGEFDRLREEYINNRKKIS